MIQETGCWLFKPPFREVARYEPEGCIFCPAHVAEVRH